MGLIELIIVLIVVGLLLYAANTWLPMDAKIKQILNVVVVIAVILWLLAVFLPGIGDVRVGD
jgi:low temperature requirement protein LtrA